MKKKTCPFEEQIQAGLKQTEFSPEIKNHIKSCHVCHETFIFYQWLRDLKKSKAETKKISKELPDANHIWEKAHSRKLIDSQKIEKAMRPLLIPQIVSYVLIVIGAVFLILVNVTDIKEFVGKNFNIGYFFDFFTVIIPKLFKTFHFLKIPMVLFLLFIFIVILYSLVSPKKA